MKVLDFKKWFGEQKPQRISDPKNDYQKGWNTGITGGGLPEKASKQFRKGFIKGLRALHNYYNTASTVYY